MARRPTIRQRIELNGGEQVEREFKELGRAGEKAFRDLQRAIRAAEGPAARFSRRIQALRGDLRRFGATARQVGSGLKTAAIAFGGLTVGIAGAAAALVALTRNATGAADELGKTATKIGTTANAYEEFVALAELSGSTARSIQGAFRRLNELIAREGLDTKDVTADLRDLNGELVKLGEFAEVPIKFGNTGATRVLKVTKENLDEVVLALKGPDGLKKAGEDGAEGLDEARRALSRLGVRLRNADGSARNTEEVFLDLVKALENVEGQAEKSGLQGLILGQRFGPDLANLVNQGAAGLENARKRLNELGVGTDANLASKLAAPFNDAFTEIEASFRARRNLLFALIAEVLTQPLNEFIDYLRTNKEQIKADLTDIANFLGQWLKDVVNTLAATRSDDGTLVFFREDQVSEANQWLITLRDSVLALAEGFTTAFGIIQKAWELYEGIVTQVTEISNNLFGTDLSGRATAIGITILAVTGILGLFVSAVTAAFLAIRILAKGGFALLLLLFPKLEGVTAKLGASFRKTFAGIGKTITNLAKIFGTTLLGAFTKFGRLAFNALSRLLPILIRFGGIPALLITGLTLVVTYWDEIVEGGEKALTALGDGIANLWEDSAAEAFFNGVVGFAQKAADAISGFFSSIFGSPAQAAAASGAGAFGAGAKQEAAEYWEAFVFASRQAWLQVSAISIAAIQKLNKDIADGVGVEAIVSALVGPFKRAFEQIGLFFTESLPKDVKTGMEEVLETVEDVTGSIVESLEKIQDTVIDGLEKIKEAAEAAKKAVDSIPSGGSSTTQGFASGGFVSGKGTGTSDSIPAWLSNGEFVIRASAVRKYGLAFLAAVNGMRFDKERPRFASGGLVKPKPPRLNLSGLLQRLSAPQEPQKFASGGLVQQSIPRLPRLNLSGLEAFKNYMPRFNMGGLVETATLPVQLPTRLPELVQPNLPGKSFDLTIGSETFQGLFAPENAVQQIEDFARRSAMKSAGQRPSWYGGRR